MLDKELLRKNIQETMEEINELLQKSGYAMKKADEMEEKKDEGLKEEDKVQPSEISEQAKEDSAPEKLADLHEESKEEHDSSAAELKEHIKSLTDEEILSLLSALQEEQALRKQMDGQIKQSEESKEEDKAAEMAPEKTQEKEEMAKMAKSMEYIASTISRLAKDVEELKAKKVEPVKTKPAAYNGQVLEKSSQPAKVERLSKSETIEFLLNEQRKGNKAVNSSIILDVNAATTESELAQIQDRLVKQGIQLPRLGS